MAAARFGRLEGESSRVTAWRLKRATNSEPGVNRAERAMGELPSHHASLLGKSWTRPFRGCGEFAEENWLFGVGARAGMVPAAMCAEEWTPRFSPVEHWRDALQAFAERALHCPAILVVGSGVSCERDDKGSWKSGVWDVPKILQYVADKPYEISSSKEGAEAYGDVLRELTNRKGDAVASRVIRRAVLAACDLPKNHPDIVHADSLDATAIKRSCQNLVNGEITSVNATQGSNHYWSISPAMMGLAGLVKDISSKRHELGKNLPPICVITTNFDELFEVTLRRIGLADQYKSFNLVGDEFPREEGELVHVWHVHGTWRDRMIHSPEEYTAARGRLQAAIQKRFDGAKVLVVGYGGWEDIVFGTLAEQLRDGTFSESPEVFWSFYERDEKQILDKYASVFRRLSPIHARLGVHYYKAVDLNLELPKIQLTFAPPHEPPPPPPRDPFRWSNQVVNALAKLAECAPVAHREQAVRFHAAAEAGTPVNYRDVVVYCCDAYECAAENERAPFAVAATDTIEAMGMDLNRWVEQEVGGCPISLEEGKVSEVRVKSPLLVELLLAGQEGRGRPNLECARPGVRSPHHPDLRAFGLFERGTQLDEWITKFEALMWRRVIRRDETYDPKLDRDPLRGELSARARRMKRIVAIVPGASERNWDDIARELRCVTFVRTRDDRAVPFDFDEFELASHIGEFLKDASSTKE